jgi:hypothetical protein
MSLLDNLKGLGSNSPGLGRSSSCNPFKFLGIGESMLNYSDGIKIKDYAFFGVLTSERFILVDNSPKGKGTIAKEMPSDLIQKAELEHEGTTPILVLHVLIEGQVRSMKLTFTGLIENPDDEARSWYTSINGRPPETALEKSSRPIQEPEQMEIEENISPPIPYTLQADAEHYTQVMQITDEYEEDKRGDRDIPTVKPNVRQKQDHFVSDGIIDAEEEEERLAAAKMALSEQKQPQPITPLEADQVPDAFQHSSQPLSPNISIQIEKREVDPRHATSIHLQKPKLTPLGRGVVEPHFPIQFREGTSPVAFCLMCGTSIPVKSRFCRICGERQ